MVATYSVVGDSFHTEKPKLWSDVQLVDVGLGSFTSNFTLHPDGKRVAFLKDPASGVPSPVTKATFILNFSDEIRRKLAASQP